MRSGIRGALVLALLGLPAVAIAQPVQPVQPAPDPQTRSTTLEDLAGDLDSERSAIRAYAARELRRRARLTRKALDKASPDSVRHKQARIDLADLTRVVLPAAIDCVEGQKSLRGTCADILGALGDERARGPLEAARDKASKRVLRRIDKALEALGG